MAHSTPERWLPVVGYEGYYEVSDHGRVRSLDRLVDLPPYGAKKRVRGRIMATTKGRLGHMWTRLSRDGKTEVALGYVLMLEAFVGPRPIGYQACHNDGDPSNNHLSNLRWGTPSENAMDAVIHGRHRNARKTHCKRGHEFTTENTYVNSSGHRKCRACARAATNASRRRCTTSPQAP